MALAVTECEWKRSVSRSLAIARTVDESSPPLASAIESQSDKAGGIAIGGSPLVERVSVVYPDLCREQVPAHGICRVRGDSMRLLVVSGRLDWSRPHYLRPQHGSRTSPERSRDQMVCRGGVFMPLFRSLGIGVYENPSSWLARRKMRGFLQEFDPHLIHATGGRFTSNQQSPFGWPSTPLRAHCSLMVAL